MSSYGVEVISKVIHALLINAWKDEKSFDEIANVLKDVPSTTILNELKEKKINYSCDLHKSFLFRNIAI